MSEHSPSDAVSSFLLGAAAGAALGLLLAPRSGEETRERLMDWLEDKREKARDLIEKERETLRHKKEQIGSAFGAAQKAYRESDRG